MLCLSCNSKYRLVAACPELTPRQRNFFVEALSQSEATLLNDQDGVLPAALEVDEEREKQVAYGEMEAEKEGKVKTLLGSVLNTEPRVSLADENDPWIFEHDFTVPQADMYLCATECFPSTADQNENSDDSYIDLGAPLSVSGGSSYPRDCHSLGMS